MSSKVLIFTKRVLPRSNTFVAAQGNNLPSFEPVYIGLRNNKTGIDLIAQKQTCVQENIEPLPVLSRLLLDGCQLLTHRWAQQLANQHANIIHAHFGKGGYYCTPIAKKLDLPLVTTFHGSDITQADKFSYNKKHRTITFQQSEKVIAVSQFVKNKLINGGCPEHKIIQHYIGIDNQFFSPVKNKYAQPTILFVGRLIEQKGCQYLLQAMKIINKRLPEAQLIIAGYGVYEQKLRALATDINNVTFVGAQNTQQVKILMSEAWVTCVPSIVMKRGNEEALGMVCIESQAVGTPVVAFNSGGVGEGVVDQQTGLLCEQKNVAQLADKLLTVLQSPSICKQLSQAGILHVDQTFNIHRQCQKLEDIYLNICKTKC